MFSVNCFPWALATGTPSHKVSVDVVDDDRDVLESLRFLLETSGFDVRTFSSGADALSQSGQHGVDCFVIDYKMANMNGIELTTQLRERNIAAPVILVTGHPDETIASKAALFGIRDVLYKPHLEDCLVARILTAIRAPS